jgi:hypothetical protein
MNYTLRNLTKQESAKLIMIKEVYNFKTKEEAIKMLIKNYPIKIVEGKTDKEYFKEF